jgi:hypothetical protein
MSQITVTLDAQLEQQLITLAAKVNLSLDTLIGGLLSQRLNNGWSTSVVNLVGAWSDDNAIQSVQPVNGSDTPRESL